MNADPLKSALEEIAPELDSGIESVMAALQANEPVEDAWEGLVQDVLDEA